MVGQGEGREAGTEGAGGGGWWGLQGWGAAGRSLSRPGGGASGGLASTTWKVRRTQGPSLRSPPQRGKGRILRADCTGAVHALIQDSSGTLSLPPCPSLPWI